jgi:acetyl-CoA C-acetyltransferase
MSRPIVVLNRGSGMKAAMVTHDLSISGTCNVIVAGHMESMTNAPYLAARSPRT